MSFLLGALGIGKAALGWLRNLPWQAWAIVAAVMLALVAAHRIGGAVDSARAAGYAAGVSDTDRKWKDAQAEADRLQAASVARTTATQAAITYEVDNENVRASADIRRRSDDLRMRHEAARRRGEAGHPGMPSTAEAACLADAEGDDGLSWDAAHAALTKAQLQQQQMNDLIDWVGRQGAVQP